MATHRIKHTFTAGELSPLMNMRSDFERYKNGCKAMSNMLCVTQGPAVRRPGFEFLYNLSNLVPHATAPEFRMIPFVFNEDQAYVLIFYIGADDVHRVLFATGDGLVLGVGGLCPVVATFYGYTGPPQDYELNSYFTDVLDIRVMYYELDETEYVLNPGFAIGNGDYYVTINDPLPNDLHMYFPVGGGGEPTSGGRIEVSFPAPITDALVFLPLPSAWDNLNFDYAQSGDEIYFAMSGLPPYLIRRLSHTCWELINIYDGMTDAPSEWSAANGWPERITFHQQRLVYAASSLYRQTVWMSKAGDFTDFSVGSPLADDDAVTFTLDSGTQNKIQWLISAKALNIGTLANEWTVTGATQHALTPTNILAQRQTNNGSEAVKPLMVGITTLFVERHGRVINEFVYDYTYDSYKTSDLAILSPHITEEYSLSEWAYQQTPDSIIWCVRSDGTLAAITYQRQHKVIGWHRHSTDGEFVTITVIPGDTREDDLWAIVKRNIDGSDVYYLEKMEDQFKSDDAEDGRFLDSFLVYSGVAADVISGLDHLEGEEVHVLAEGSVHPPVTVVGGDITLNDEYTHVVIGLQYVSEIRPFVADISLKDGTTFGRSQRITDIDVDFYRSLGVYIGRDDQEDGEHEEEKAFRTPADLTGVAVPLFTGIKHVSFPEGFDRKVEYYIRQYQPLPLTIRGVVDVVEVYE